MFLIFDATDFFASVQNPHADLNTVFCVLKKQYNGVVL